MAGKSKHITQTYAYQDKQIRAAIEYGIDISMLIDNINRTPAERIKRHQAALNAVEKIQKAKHI